MENVVIFTNRLVISYLKKNQGGVSKEKPFHSYVKYTVRSTWGCTSFKYLALAAMQNLSLLSTRNVILR